MAEIPVAVVSRPWISLKSRFSPAAKRFAHARRPSGQARGLPGSTPPQWVFLRGPLNFQSSTLLRERMRRSRS
jgi:nicotinate-nucleotide adenylyltransferase